MTTLCTYTSKNFSHYSLLKLLYKGFPLYILTMLFCLSLLSTAHGQTRYGDLEIKIVEVSHNKDGMEARWRVRALDINDQSADTIQLGEIARITDFCDSGTGDNVVVEVIKDITLFSETGICLSSLAIEVETWDEDGCGEDDEFNPDNSCQSMGSWSCKANFSEARGPDKYRTINVTQINLNSFVSGITKSETISHNFDVNGDNNDNNNFKTSIDLEITWTSSGTALASGIESLCSGESVTLDAGDFTNATYEWSTGETTEEITVNSAGEYNVDITIDGCTFSSGTVTVNVAESISDLQFTDVVPNPCPGTSSTYTATVEGDGSIMYSLSPVEAGTINSMTGEVDWDNDYTGSATITAEATGCGNPLTENFVAMLSNEGPAFTTSVSTVCAGQGGVHFAIESLDENTSYNWTSEPAGLSFSGQDFANASFDFPTSGTFDIILETTLQGCTRTTRQAVVIESNPVPSPIEVWLDASVNNLVCLNNTVESYQWGYDDGENDLKPVTLDGETGQDYSAGNTLDLIDKFYWVITKSGNGCETKSYYNRPTLEDTERTVNIPSALEPQITAKVYPNPNTGSFHLNLSSEQSGRFQYRVFDISGRAMRRGETYKLAGEQTTQISLGQVQPGMYFLQVLSERGVEQTIKLQILPK